MHVCCRHAWNPRKVQDVTYDANIAVPTGPAVQQTPIKITVLGSWWAAMILVCATMMCLASAFTAFILYVRPVLQVSSAFVHPSCAQNHSMNVQHQSDVFQAVDDICTLSALHEPCMNSQSLCKLYGGVYWVCRGPSERLWLARLQRKAWKRHPLSLTRLQRWVHRSNDILHPKAVCVPHISARGLEHLWHQTQALQIQGLFRQAIPRDKEA